MTAPNFSAVRALIFDLDGTLIDSKLDLIRSVNAMLLEMGREELHQDTISGYIGHGAPQLVGQALGNNSIEAERERALKFFLAYYEDHKTDSTCAYPGVPEALAHLAAFPMLGAQMILREFGATPAEAILIGDSEVDVQTARNAGTFAAAVNYGFGAHDRTAHPADIYLDRLTDLVALLGNRR